MKKRYLIANFVVVVISLFSLSTTTFAATLFNDTADTFDYTKYLPVMVGGSLVIEALAIMLLTDIKRIVNVSFAVLVANTASFVLPRLALGLYRHEVFYKGMFTEGFLSSNWLAAGVYFVISLIIELPILYFMLRVFTPKKVRLMIIAAGANIVTTAAIAFAEFQIHNWLVSQ